MTHYFRSLTDGHGNDMYTLRGLGNIGKKWKEIPARRERSNREVRNGGQTLVNC